MDFAAVFNDRPSSRAAEQPSSRVAELAERQQRAPSPAMTTRRTFVSSIIGAGATLPVMRQSAFRHLLRAEPIAADRPTIAVAEDETYWREIQRAFDLDRTMVNLNNGGCSPAPTHVLEQ